MARKQRNRASQMRNRALNAFDTAVDDEEYIKGTRQQQDIDLDNFADERIKELLNGEVASDDDEDLDSDEAIGSGSDIEINLNEDEDEDDWGASVDEDEMVSLSAAWDMDSDDESGAKKADFKAATNEIEADSLSGSELESELESGSEEESGESELESEEDSGSELGFSDMESVDSDEEDDSALRQAIKSVSNGSMKTNSRLATNVGAENPHMLPTSGEKLSLDDLTGASNADLKLVQPKVKPKTLSVPLPQRVQSRIDNKASYGLAKEEVSKWEDTVKTNRRAEHLSFPINPKVQAEKVSPFVAPSVDNRTELERKVQELLTQSSLADERAASAFEDLAPSNLSLEELRKRRDELRYKRELMFREEQKAKRIKKIKSKSYRRVHKKERMKQEALMKEAGLGSDEELDDEDKERQRALERASLKHKTTSKWAKRMIEHGMSKDADTRGEMEEMLRQGEDLRRKVMGGRGSDDEAGDYSDASGDENVFDLNAGEAADEPERKGVMAMKFMQDADDRQRKANQRMLADEAEESDEEANLGRRSFNPAAAQAKRDADDAAAASEDEFVPSGKYNKKRKRVGDEEVILRREPAAGAAEGAAAHADEAADDAGANPWLNLGAAAKHKSTFQTVTKDSSRADKAAHKLKKANKSKYETEHVDIDVNDTLGAGLVREDQLSLQQQDLVRKAFAGDDVVAEFQAEKQQEVEQDGDKEVEETLPGWGSWGGEGLKPRVRRFRHETGIAEKSRKDFNKTNVIISERTNKKNERYNASAVPFPFENRAQYERSLRMPIGNEWSTKDTFQRQTKPRVVVKRGEIIDPIKRPNHGN